MTHVLENTRTSAKQEGRTNIHAGEPEVVLLVGSQLTGQKDRRGGTGGQGRPGARTISGRSKGTF